MNGWNARILRIDLSGRKVACESYDAEFAMHFIGGRGFAAEILWNEARAGLEPLSAESVLVFATGPLTGFPLPSSGKVVVAAKSPLTGGYGEGILGTFASIHLRRAGFDVVVVKGRAERPSIITIDDDRVDILPAEDLWGLGTFSTEKELKDRFGRNVGSLMIGPAGENLVYFATVASMEGRSGGRPGIGAVMGSKNLKALVAHGTGNLSSAHPEELRSLGTAAFRELLAKPGYESWKKSGTMATVDWAQNNGVLPTLNFREGVFEDAEKIDSTAMEKIKVQLRGCPNCNIVCGNVVNDAEGKQSELDYENVAMLGSNIGLGDLQKIAVLNRIADDYGVDAISLGSAIGFAMECSEKGLLQERIEWGDLYSAKNVAEEIVRREGVGELLAQGTRRAAEKIAGGSHKWAMQVKGLEVSAYDCHSFPGMALAFGTSPIGAHHKDAWIMGWEVNSGKDGYSLEKVEKLLELQRIRSMVECFSVCRFPWLQFGLPFDWYLKFFKAVTGVERNLEDFNIVSDRVYSLIRGFWVREYGAGWSRLLDQPPRRWFEEPTTRGPLKGEVLKRDGYEQMLDWYYEKKGWTSQGVPRRKTLEKLGLSYVAEALPVTFFD